MCGFAGIIHWDGEGVPPEEMARMCSLLRHRGPDEQVAVQPGPGVGLSHCRLKIIDLSEAARQPMADEGKGLWVCFNGEIYNFLELRSELESRGAVFRSRSDTEVILRAYERWGAEAIHRLDGMFAIAVWDSRRRELLLARDRTGKKPLYWWTDGRCLAFASEIKALAAHPHVPREIDASVLPHLLALGYPPPGRGCYREIRQALPASRILFRAGDADPAPESYWALPAPSETRPPSLGEAKEQLRDLLSEAVRRRLISDVPLGAFLSGGLDSTLVVGLMSRLSPGRPVRTFSIGFEGDPRFDETPFAELAARRFGTEHTLFRVSPQPFELLERLVWHFDQPFGDSSALPTYLLCQLTRRHVTVALNGDGGDELFAGYDRFRAALLAERIPLWLRRAGRRLSRRAGASFHVRSILGRAAKFLALAQEPFPLRLLKATGYLDPPEGFLLQPRDASAVPSVWRRYLPPPTGGSVNVGLRPLLELNFREYLPNDLHVKMDRCSMAHGLETRSPFLDTALVEWAFRLPDDLKLRGNISKWILRQAFQGLVPAAIRRRGKAGFGAPLGAWFRGQWREPMRDLLGSPEARIYRYLRFEAVQKLLQEHLDRRSDWSQPIWLLLTLEIWLRQMARPIDTLSGSRYLHPVESARSPA